MQSHINELQETSFRISTKQEELKMTVLNISLVFILYQSRPSEYKPEFQRTVYGAALASVGALSVRLP